MTDAPKPNLIFMIGLTGSGKSRLKDVLVNEFPINDDKQPEPIDDKQPEPKVVVSVDDVFEEDSKSKEIFYELYKGHFGTDQCSNIDKLTEKIKIEDKLNILFPENKNTFEITKKCVLSQISYRYGIEEINEKTEISFSKFASAIYFALRVKRLDRKYDESIRDSVNNGKNVIIETNGESADSITAWYQGESKSNNNTETNPCKAEGDAIDLKEKLKEYNKIVCFLRRDICDTIDGLKKRALKDVCKFINNKEEFSIPRLPEIEDKILVEKMKKINDTYKAFKEDREKNSDKSVEVRVYNNIKDAEIEQFKVNDLPISLYKNTEIKCETTGGRKSKRRKSKRRKSKQRKSKRRKLTKSKK